MLELTEGDFVNLSYQGKTGYGVVVKKGTKRYEVRYLILPCKISAVVDPPRQLFDLGGHALGWAKVSDAPTISPTKDIPEIYRRLLA